MSEEGALQPDQRSGTAASVTEDGWQSLRRLTAARIALGHCGVSLPTQAHLSFQLAHARARDAVHQALDAQAMLTALAATGLPAIPLASQAVSRVDYLRRPDLGRRLDEASVLRLQAERPEERPEVVFIIGDGLSPVAVERNAVELLAVLLPALVQAGWRVGPLSVVRHARVAIGDEIGQLLRAEMG